MCKQRKNEISQEPLALHIEMKDSVGQACLRDSGVERDGSVVKSLDCSSRGPGCISHHPTRQLTTSCNFSSRESSAPLGTGVCIVNRYIDSQMPIHKIKIIKF